MPGVVEAVGEHWAATFGVDLGNHWTHAGDVRVGVFDRGFGEDPTAKTEMCLGQRRASCPTAETSSGSWVPNTQQRFASPPLGSAARVPSSCGPGRAGLSGLSPRRFPQGKWPRRRGRSRSGCSGAVAREGGCLHSVAQELGAEEKPHGGKL